MLIGQSSAIIAVILVMSFMFLRSGRRAGALFALPLISVPLFHLVGVAVYRFLVQSEFPTAALHIGIDITGLVLGLVLCGILARAISVKRLSNVYFICCAVFQGALATAYILHLLNLL